MRHRLYIFCKISLNRNHNLSAEKDCTVTPVLRGKEYWVMSALGMELTKTGFYPWFSPISSFWDEKLRPQKGECIEKIIQEISNKCKFLTHVFGVSQSKLYHTHMVLWWKRDKQRYEKSTCLLSHPKSIVLIQWSISEDY